MIVVVVVFIVVVVIVVVVVVVVVVDKDFNVLTFTSLPVSAQGLPAAAAGTKPFP